MESLNKQIMELRTSTAAAEAKRMDAQRREQASIDEARRWRNDIEGLREKLREQETAANREASHASAREAYAPDLPSNSILQYNTTVPAVPALLNCACFSYSICLSESVYLVVSNLFGVEQRKKATCSTTN